MNFFDLFYIIFEEKGESLLLLDIDDTLVIPTNIFIYKKNKDGSETALTPQEYSKQSEDVGNEYDFRDFRDPKKIYNSIKTGIPIIPNLRVFDEYVKRGWKIGILTARGMEEVVYKALKDWLLFRNKQGDLQELGPRLVRDLVHAINTQNRGYVGETSSERKANVVRKLAKEYDRIVLIDDDLKNIEAIRELGLKNVYTKLAHKMEIK